MDSTGQKREEYKGEANIEGFGDLLDFGDAPTTEASQPDSIGTGSVNTTGSGIDELLDLGTSGATAVPP